VNILELRITGPSVLPPPSVTLFSARRGSLKPILWTTVVQGSHGYHHRRLCCAMVAGPALDRWSWARRYRGRDLAKETKSRGLSDFVSETDQH
jgi:hypothetical protein